MSLSCRVVFKAEFSLIFYLNSDFIPKVINVFEIPTNKEQLINWLKEKRNGNVYIKVPIKGDKAREIRLAKQNAKLLKAQRKI